MKYALISDVHANLEALTAVLARLDDIAVDQIVCLGDVVGYNANPNECVELIRERQIPTVCGNHDAVACGIEEPLGFNPIALSAALWTRENLSRDNLDWLSGLPVNLEFDGFLAAHGSPTDRDAYLFTWEDVLPHLPLIAESGKDLCFFGHTHTPGIFSSDGRYTVDDESKFALGDGKAFFINPGSVGQPRDGDARAAFGLYDSEAREYELVRVEYPVQEAAERILGEELPHFLAERLFLGR
ncbi:MAG: metallophosphoesterase family protein [Candidatus Hydrogenedentes bacterium]|nr:metallophosphoesterase family protein [Candidatus Hydrogenedentota bacterium]